MGYPALQGEQIVIYKWAAYGVLVLDPIGTLLEKGSEERESMEMKQKNSVWTKIPVVFAAAFACCFLWGSASPAIKIGYAMFSIGADDLFSRILFAGVRFMIAGVMVILFGSLMQRSFLRPTWKNFPHVLTLAFFQTVFQYIFFYMGLAHISGVRGSIINACGTFFSIFLSAFLFRFEKLTMNKLFGSLIGFSGVLLIITGGSLEFLKGGFTMQGEGAMVLAAFAYGLSSCFIKMFSQKDNPVMLSGWQFLIGGAVMTAAGLIMGGQLVAVSPWCVPLILYMGFISAGAYTLWGVLLKFNEVSKVSVLGFMNPVLGVLLSAAFLGEQSEAFSLTGLAALLLVSAGIALANLRKKPES